ncbi:YeaC family protein [Marinobacter sp. C2H3]|uniref:YeaC family protein n=1 Tax=Marinobacter sp. C2H3 TaxID=3119003 RepID=UPI00300F72AC
MTYEQLIERLDPTVYRNLRQSLELGKWPDGRPMTKEQRAISLEAVIYYENLHNVPEQERVGYLDRGEKAGTACDPSVRFSQNGAGNPSDGPEADPNLYVEVKS